mgnify:CR=1 FL=1
MKRVIVYLKRETVLCIAVFLAVISMFFVRPDRAYAEYIDTRVLALLFCLMTIMEGFKKTGLFEQMANTLLKKVHTFRQLMLVLVGLCFFCSMWITNDVALLTFVPFTILVLRMAKLDQRMIPVITMETIAANLGSMATPVGNPQNLYLYSVSGMSALSFVKVMGPLSLVSLLLLIGGCLLQKNESMQIEQIRRKTKKNKTAENLILLFLFCVSLATVLRVLSWPVLLGITLLICLFLFGSGKEEFLPLRVDYSLLLTFVAFFIFIGNAGRISAFSLWLNQIIEGREVIVAVLASQIISNVPTALLLSGFTNKISLLIIGTNLGGLGTLIASMASLISYRQIAQEETERKGKYFLIFTISNVIFLLILLGVWKMTGVQ